MENEKSSTATQQTKVESPLERNGAVEKGSASGFQKEHNEKEAEVSSDAAAEGEREKSDAV